jgi:ferredoxin
MTDLQSAARVTADPTICIAAGSCPLIAPEIFELDPDEGTVLAVDREVSGRDAEAAQAAADQCPSGAIMVEPR